MKRTTIKEQGNRLVRQKTTRAAKGGDVLVQRNSGKYRSASKRMLLETIEKTAAASGRSSKFKAKF